MTYNEFSDAFDTLINSHSGISSLDFNEYEKSLFLTNALDKIVNDLYKSGFEKTEEIRTYLKPLIKTVGLTNSTISTYKFSPNSKAFTLPTDIMFITKEWLVNLDNELVNIKVYPLDEIVSVLSNPFKQNNIGKALRIVTTSDKAEIIYDGLYSTYVVVYLKKPSPIITVDLGDLKINGISTVSTTELTDSFILKEILNQAVRDALVSRSTAK